MKQNSFPWLELGALVAGALVKEAIEGGKKNPKKKTKEKNTITVDVDGRVVTVGGLKKFQKVKK